MNCPCRTSPASRQQYVKHTRQQKRLNGCTLPCTAESHRLPESLRLRMRRVPRHRAQRKCHPFECRTWFLGTESGDDHARHIQFDRAGGCAPSQPSLSPSHARLDTVCRYRRARVVSTRFPALTPCHHRALPPGSQEKFLSPRPFVFSNSLRLLKHQRETYV